MKILGIIPARSGSKRIPGKNKKYFNGKPLIRYVIEAAIGSKLLDKIVVNTDDEDILKIANDYEGIQPLKRPTKLAQDHSPAIDYVHQTLDVLKGQGQTFDIIAILQPTSPLTLSSDIDSTIRKLLQTNADTAVSVVELNHMINPLKLKMLDGDKVSPYLENENGRMAAHEIPKVYVRNCAVYATTINTINQNRIIGEDCRAFVMPPERSVDINDKLDFEFAEFLHLKLFKNSF